VVEDEPSLADSIQYSLEREGFQVQIAADGERAISRFREGRPSLVLLDLMLPKLSGLDVCRIIRQESTIPIVILTAKDGEADKVAGLELGADDYVTKPFSMRELISRVRAHLRRAGMGAEAAPVELLRGGPVELDLARHEARVRGEEVRLTPKEFELLTLLAQHAGRVLTHRTILKAIWGPNAVDQPEHLRVLIGSLRKKIEANPSSPKYILTEPWVGYRFVDP
jgi:DNA-binding response OmpR family regulator